jgi:hypothetical protein
VNHPLREAHSWPSRFDTAWLTCAIAAAASWIVCAAAALCGDHVGGDEALLLVGWGVTVALPVTLLGVRLYPAQRLTVVAYRAYRLGRLHAREVEADRAADLAGME